VRVGGVIRVRPGRELVVAAAASGVGESVEELGLAEVAAVSSVGAVTGAVQLAAGNGKVAGAEALGEGAGGVQFSRGEAVGDSGDGEHAGGPKGANGGGEDESGVGAAGVDDGKRANAAQVPQEQLREFFRGRHWAVPS
jgi:hypothetical protein